MKSYRYMALALCTGTVAASAYGYGTVYSETYVEGHDYSVHYHYDAPPDIEILLPSTSGPYWFECYEGDEPAAIRSITAAPDLGTVDVKVTGYDTHTYGASDVWKIQIGQTSGGGRLVDLTISGSYGDPADPESGTLIADSADVIDIGGNLVKPAVIATEGAPANLASFNVTGDLLPQATVTIYGDTTTFGVSGDILPEAAVTIEGDVTTLSVDGDILAPVTIHGDVTTFTCATTGPSAVAEPHEVAADVDVTGHLDTLVAGVISAQFTVGGYLGSSSLSKVVELDGTLEVGTSEAPADLTGQFRVDDSLGGCLCVWGNLTPDGQDGFHVKRLFGTLCVGGDLGDPGGAKVAIDDLRAQGEIHVGTGPDGGSVVGPLNFDWLAGVVNVHGDVVENIESSYDITGRIVVDGDLRAWLHAAYGLVHYADLPPEDGGQIVISGTVVAGRGIQIIGAIDDGRIDVGSLAGTISAQDVNGGQIEVGSLAGSVGVTGDIANGGAVAVSTDLSGTLAVDHAVQQDCSVHVGQDINAGHVAIGMLAGSVDVVRDLTQGGQVIVAGEFDMGGVVDEGASIAIGRDINDGQVQVGWLAGGIEVSGGVVEGGEVAVEHDVTGTLTVGGNVSAGSINVASLAGTIDLGGGIVESGAVAVDGDLSGALVVAGDLGSQTGADSISAGDLIDGGHIIINGSLRESGSITVDGAADNVWDDEFITIGYDGYDQDEWYEPATVTVTYGPQAGVYTWNTPEHNIFLVRCLVGDLDNDEDVDYEDLDIYAENIWGEPDPQGKYCGNYPGLCGSLHYHADADCSGSIGGNAAEWSAMNMKVDTPNKWYSSYHCELACIAPGEDGLLLGGMGFGSSEAEGEDGLEVLEVGLTPAEKAALLLAQFGSDRLSLLIAICDDAAATLTDPDEAQFWADVAAELAAE
jgi:hypothetical protein